MCYPCVEAAVAKSFRAGIRTLGGFSPGGTLAAAVSEGRASAVMLHLLALTHCEDSHKRGKGQMPFTMHVVHIHNDSRDNTVETSGFGGKERTGGDVQPDTDIDTDGSHASGEALNHAAADMRSKIRAIIEDQTAYIHIADLSDVYEDELSGKEERQQRLQMLFGSIADPSGRSDLEKYLRRMLILRIASLNGCSHVAFAHTADALATEAIASVSKGRGYSFPSDVAPGDARYGSEVPVIVRPMREVSREEVGVVFEHLERCGKIVTTKMEHAGGTNESNEDADPDGKMDKGNIHRLAEQFVRRAIEQNPGAVSNIMSAVGKLQTFYWNDVSMLRASSRAEAKSSSCTEEEVPPVEDLRSDNAKRAEVLCPLCDAPLADDELEYCLLNVREGSRSDVDAHFDLPCCDSCRQGIFVLRDSSRSPTEIWSLLPRRIVRRAQVLAEGLKDSSMENDAWDLEVIRRAISCYILRCALLAHPPLVRR